MHLDLIYFQQLNIKQIVENFGKHDQSYLSTV